MSADDITVGDDITWFEEDPFLGTPVIYEGIVIEIILNPTNYQEVWSYRALEKHSLVEHNVRPENVLGKNTESSSVVNDYDRAMKGI